MKTLLVMSLTSVLLWCRDTDVALAYRLVLHINTQIDSTLINSTASASKSCKYTDLVINGTTFSFNLNWQTNAKHATIGTVTDKNASRFPVWICVDQKIA